MPKTRASTRRLTAKRKASRKEHASTSDDSLVDNFVPSRHENVEAEPGMSIMDHLKGVRSGVEELNFRIRSLEQENGSLRSKLQEVQQNVHRTRGGSFDQGEGAPQRRIQSLERTITNLKAAREKDRRTIEKARWQLLQFRETEVQRDAKDLVDDFGGAMPNPQTTDLGERAVKLLRQVCDTIDMNSLAEGEECAVCIEEMAVEKCYSLPCRHPVCSTCFDQLRDGSSTVVSDSVQCPHCREVFLRTECEIITHTAVEQWDLLLDVSRQWVAMDIAEMDIGEDDGGDSFVDDGSVATTESPCPTETLGEAADLDPEIPAASASPNDAGAVAYKNLPSPLKRKRLSQLVAQRAVKQRM